MNIFMTYLNINSILMDMIIYLLLNNSNLKNFGILIYSLLKDNIIYYFCLRWIYVYLNSNPEI